MSAGDDRPAPIGAAVHRARGRLVRVGADDLERLRSGALVDDARKCRLILHPGTDDPLHEMIIVHTRGAYIRPHRAVKTSKTYHVLDGTMVLALFANDGELRERLEIGDRHASAPFLARLMEPVFHTVVPLSETVTFIETVPGPWTGTEPPGRPTPTGAKRRAAITGNCFAPSASKRQSTANGYGHVGHEVATREDPGALRGRSAHARHSRNRHDSGRSRA